MKKRLVLIISVFAVALIVLFAFIGHTKEIDLDDYVEIEVTGVNGYGKATVEIDWLQLQEDHGDKVKETDRASYMFSVWGRYTLADAVKETVKYSLSQYDRLSNGDTVTMMWTAVTADYLSAFDVELDYGSIEYTVKGLEEVTEFDAFSSIRVAFEGVSPGGSAYIIADENSKFDLRDLSLDKNSDLSNGETVKVTINQSAIMNYVEQYGAVPVESEKEYVVSGLEYYASKLSQINSDSLENMKKQANDVHLSKIAGWVSPETCKGAEFIGNYFLAAKSEEKEDIKNQLYLVYKINVETATEKFSYYWYLKYENITVLPDGTLSVDYQEYITPHMNHFFGVTGEGFERGGLGYEGYEKLNALYNNCVVKNIDRYVFENTVEN